MGQQVSVETFASSRDPEGFKYWTSFDPYPFKVGSKKLVYMGILNGEGPLKGQKCVVKTVKNGSICKKEWELQSRRARVAREMANSYNKVASNTTRKITFNCPVVAEIDTLSDCLCINDILGKPKKKWNDAEFVSIELYLRGKFEDFEYGWVPRADLIVPEAFSHFTWCRSEGNLLVSNLQGVKTSCAFRFTGPVIHSADKKFGTSDLGFEGIKGFFKLHTCNEVCRQWPRLGDGVDFRGWGEYIAVGQKYPTAPPLFGDLPPPPPYEESDSNCVPYSSVDPFVNRQVVPFVRAEQAETDTESPENGEMARAQTSEYHRSWMSQQYNSVNFVQSPPHETVYRRNTSQWRHSGRGLVIDWREELFNQRTTFDPYFGRDNPMLYYEELRWIVKQLRCTVFIPPPEYQRFEPRGGEMVPRHSVTTDIEDSSKYYPSDDDDDHQCLLPPPYSEASVASEIDCVTYL